MYACISNGLLVSRSDRIPSGAGILKGLWVPEISQGTNHNKISESLLGPVTVVEDHRVVYQYSTVAKPLDQSQRVAKEILGDVSHKIRESGFISAVTGQWTGVLSKENIIRAETVAKSARNAAAEGRGLSSRAFKMCTTREFIHLTNDAIVAIDDEINGDTGFIQQCYNREAEIAALIDAVSTDSQAVSDLYDTESVIGWPDHE